MAESRHALYATTRWMVPLAIVLGLVGAGLSRAPLGRALFGGGALAIAALWGVSRMRRPELVVDEQGYRVEEGRREKLRVGFAEVKRVRAVPQEQAMYLDCGDPARNLLLPTRHGFGFRFARQGALYALLARSLDGKIEIAETLLPPEEKKKKK
jgi:hypothetical protein